MDMKLSEVGDHIRNAQLKKLIKNARLHITALQQQREDLHFQIIDAQKTLTKLQEEAIQ